MNKSRANLKNTSTWSPWKAAFRYACRIQWWFHYGCSMPATWDQGANKKQIFIMRMRTHVFPLSSSLKYDNPQVLSLCKVTSAVSNSLQPYGLQPARLLCPRDFPGENTGVSCHAFPLQRIFPTQGLNPHLIMSLILAGRFLTTSASWEAFHYGVLLRVHGEIGNQSQKLSVTGNIPRKITVTRLLPA